MPRVHGQRTGGQNLKKRKQKDLKAILALLFAQQFDDLEEKKKILTANGQSVVDVDNQINQKRIDAQKSFNALAAAEQKQFDDIQTQIKKDTFDEDQALQDQALKELLKVDTTVLIKGSRGSKMEEVVEAIK